MKRPAHGGIFPPVPALFFMPFYYASLSSFKIYYRVDAAALEPFLKGTTLKVARFSDSPEDQGVVSVEFQNYTGHGGTLLETTDEVEFDILAYPETREPLVPVMPLLDFVKGRDQTRTIGFFRVYVPCDNPFAVQAGRQIFGEPKFTTTFSYAVPSLNLPKQKNWTYTVLDPKCKPPKNSKQPPKAKDIIYTLEANLQSLHPQPGTPSPIVLYSMYPQLPNGGLAGSKGYGRGYRLIGSNWNIFGVDDIYVLDKSTRRKVKMTFGKSTHPMRSDMQKIMGSCPAAMVQVYQSPPVATESRAAFVDV